MNYQKIELIDFDVKIWKSITLVYNGVLSKDKHQVLLSAVLLTHPNTFTALLIVQFTEK